MSHSGYICMEMIELRPTLVLGARHRVSVVVSSGNLGSGEIHSFATRPSWCHCLDDVALCTIVPWDAAYLSTYCMGFILRRRHALVVALGGTLRVGGIFNALSHSVVRSICLNPCLFGKLTSAIVGEVPRIITAFAKITDTRATISAQEALDHSLVFIKLVVPSTIGSHDKRSTCHYTSPPPTTSPRYGCTQIAG